MVTAYSAANAKRSGVRRMLGCGRGGGCIVADASNAGTSAAVTLHQISMHRNITPLRVTR